LGVLQFDPFGKARFDSPCDLAKGWLARAGIGYQGLWYPIVIAGTTFVIGLFLVPETRGHDIDA